jgi:hypothetical protein
MEKKLKRRQEDEGNKKIKRREPSQEDESDKPHDLEFIHPTSQPKPRIFP